jgi:hypothetical protein
VAYLVAANKCYLLFAILKTNGTFFQLMNMMASHKIHLYCRSVMVFCKSKQGRGFSRLGFVGHNQERNYLLHRNEENGIDYHRKCISYKKINHHFSSEGKEPSPLLQRGNFMKTFQELENARVELDKD